jgi:hypothetical protein
LPNLPKTLTVKSYSQFFVFIQAESTKSVKKLVVTFAVRFLGLLNLSHICVEQWESDKEKEACEEKKRQVHG